MAYEGCDYDFKFSMCTRQLNHVTQQRFFPFCSNDFYPLTLCRWEVPLPRAIKVIYSSLHGEGTDPRFVKLKPVFRCSMLKSGGVHRYLVCLSDIFWKLFL